MTGRIHHRFYTTCCRVEVLPVALGRWRCPACGDSFPCGFDDESSGGFCPRIRALARGNAPDDIDDMPTAVALAQAALMRDVPPEFPG